MEYSDKDFHIEFDDLPSLIPILLKTQEKSFFKALQGASARRRFKLEDDWQIRIQLNNKKYDNHDLGGTIVIPVSWNQSTTLLDGASVPLPWLVSFLSFGVLRPLGVMLTASIVHDFAFKHGGLVYVNDVNDAKSRELKPIRRDLADKLFHNIIKAVNNMPITALLAWLAVRLGWFFVKYADKPRGGKFPSIAVAVIIAVLFLLGGVIWLFGFETVVTSVALFYLFMFFCFKFSALSTEE